LILSWIASFIGILAIAYFHQGFLNDADLTLMIGSFGASAVLVYAAAQSPMAQPRNLIFGHIFSAVVGVVAFKFLSFDILICSAFAVATSILVMQLTRTLHPPGGATALIAVVGSEQVHALGFYYILSPVLSGALILYLTAYLINIFASHRLFTLLKERS
jgi:CBS-domain-containing membrane protein